MFKNSSIKFKLLTTLVASIVIVALAILFESIYSMKEQARNTLEETKKLSYETKEKELKNYVSLAYKTVESYYARTSKDKIKEEVKNYIKEQSDFLFSIITSEYEKNKNLMNEEELKLRIKAIVEATRYGKSGYFWINDFDYKMVMHPIKKELSGKYFKNTPKVPFVELGANELKKTGKDTGYIEYSFYNPTSKETTFKASIVRVFKPYNWILGTGAYIDDISEKMKQEALTAIENMKYGKTGYFWINDSNHVVQAHGGNASLAGKDMTDLQDKKGTYLYREIVKTANEKKEGGLVKYFWSIPGKKGVYEKFSYVQKFEPWDLIIGTGAYITNIEDHLKSINENTSKSINSAIMQIIIIVVLIILLFSVATIFVMNKVIVKPLAIFENGLLDFFKYVNKEQDEITPLVINSNDEIGKMSKLINENIQRTKTIIEQDNLLIEDVKNIVNHVGKGFLDKRVSNSTNNMALEELKSLLNNMLDNIQKLVGININTLNEVLEEYANRNFTKKINPANSGKIGADIINMNKMITKILLDNQKDGMSLQNRSNELTTNVRILNDNANSQAASLEETAASIEEITGNIKQTSEKAQEMLLISNQTQKSAHIGKDLASKTVNSMDKINETVIAINESISVIDQIAFQTNILSLNAAVEAATAGEAGKGFAVVAQEVRNLASRSAEAAKEIKELVESATIKANEGIEISKSMIEGFTTLESKITTTSQLIDDVTNAAKEQNTGMIQISDAVNQLDKFTQENAAIADKTNDIARETNSIANDIVVKVNENNFDGKA
ncbi:MAG: cache domain-containing protein [Halarcobacter sp.]